MRTPLNSWRLKPGSTSPLTIDQTTGWHIAGRDARQYSTFSPWGEVDYATTATPGF
jgi:hypothetical protein